MSEAYDRSIAVKAMVLLEIRKAGEPILGRTLLERVEQAGRRADRHVSGYDFVSWVGCTLWELLGTFLNKGWIALNGVRPFRDEQLANATIHTTEQCARYIEAVRAEAPKQLAYFD
jgi:hypothetical protein